MRRPVTFNPANQAATETIINTTYVWDAHPTSTTQVDYAINGLNQITQADANTFTYDANGNLTSDGQTGYLYDQENRLVAASGAFTAELRYDPLGRLHEVKDGSGGIRRMLYDGDALVAEYNGTGAMFARYIHGADAGDDPLIRYPGSATAYTAAEHLYADRRGSIYASFDRSGAAKAINSYDEYGVSGDSSGIYNTGRFGYTGQAWVPEAGLYYYKARMYSPSLGRFMQTDPIGYADGMNMYTYVGNDPVNGIDPSGTYVIVVQGFRGLVRTINEWDLSDFRRVGTGATFNRDIVVRATKEKDKTQRGCGAGTFFTGTDSQGNAICAPEPEPEPPCSIAPASRTYPIPEGYEGAFPDGKNLYIRPVGSDPAEAPLLNPAYEAVLDARPSLDKREFATDLGMIAASSAFPFLTGGVHKVSGGLMTVGTSGAKTVWELIVGDDCSR